MPAARVVAAEISMSVSLGLVRSDMGAAVSGTLPETADRQRTCCPG